jgi:hypothetical protein
MGQRACVHVSAAVEDGRVFLGPGTYRRTLAVGNRQTSNTTTPQTLGHHRPGATCSVVSSAQRVRTAAQPKAEHPQRSTDLPSSAAAPPVACAPPLQVGPPVLVTSTPYSHAPVSTAQLDHGALVEGHAGTRQRAQRAQRSHVMKAHHFDQFDVVLALSSSTAQLRADHYCDVLTPSHPEHR